MEFIFSSWTKFGTCSTICISTLALTQKIWTIPKSFATCRRIRHWSIFLCSGHANWGNWTASRKTDPDLLLHRFDTIAIVQAIQCIARCHKYLNAFCMNLGYFLTKLLQLLWPSLLTTKFSCLQRNKLGHASLFISLQMFKLALLAKGSFYSLWAGSRKKISSEMYIPQNALF